MSGEIGKKTGKFRSLGRRTFLTGLGIVGLTSALGSGAGTSVNGDTASSVDGDGSDHDHGGDRLGAEEPLASVTAERINDVRYATAFSGRSGGQRIQTAINDL